MEAAAPWSDVLRPSRRGGQSTRILPLPCTGLREESIGVDEDERNVRNKVSRGKFTAAFMLQCLAALGSHTLHLA